MCFENDLDVAYNEEDAVEDEELDEDIEDTDEEGY